MNTYDGKKLSFNLTQSMLEYITSYVDMDRIYVLYNINSNDIQQIHINSPIPTKCKVYLPLGFLASNNVVDKLYNESDPSKSISVFEEFNIDLVSYPTIHKISSNIVFKKKLRQSQIEILEKFDNIINKLMCVKAPLIMSLTLNTGGGKTLLTFVLAHKLGLKVLYLYPRRSLIPQGLEQAKEAGFNSIGSLKGSKYLLNNYKKQSYEEDEDDEVSQEDIKKLKDVDILFAVFHHFKSRDFKEYAMNHFSMLVIDESHKANLFTNKALGSSLIYPTFPFTLFLSATPQPNTSYFTGYNISFEYYTNINKYIISVPNYNFKDIYIPRDNVPYKNDNKYKSKKIHIIEKDLCRNLTIFYSLEDKLDKKILILCTHRVYMNLYYDLCSRYYKTNILKIDAKLPKESIEVKYNIMNNKYENFILISTMDSLSNGTDIESLDILYIISVNLRSSTIIQALGRLARGKEGCNKFAFIFPEISNKRFKNEMSNNADEILNIAANAYFKNISIEQYYEDFTISKYNKDIETDEVTHEILYKIQTSTIKEEKSNQVYVNMRSRYFDEDINE